MKKRRSSITLIAEWAPNDDPTIDPPNKIHWGNNSPATIQDYVAHIDDTFEWADCSVGPKRVCYPDILATVRYDQIAGVWEVGGRGVVPASLRLTDPNTSDQQIIDELHDLPIVYRAQIHRPERALTTNVFGPLTKGKVPRSVSLFWIASFEQKKDWLIFAHNLRTAAQLHKEDAHCTIDSRRCKRVLQSVYIQSPVSGAPPSYAHPDDLVELGFQQMEAPAGILAFRLGSAAFVEGYQFAAIPEMRDDPGKFQACTRPKKAVRMLPLAWD